MHPEDIEIGDYLAPFDIERPDDPLARLFGECWETDEPQRWAGPAVKRNVPLKVIGVCLPYLHCEKWDETTVVYDLRKISFYRLDRKFAKRLSRSLREDEQRRRKRRRLSRRGDDEDLEFPGSSDAPEHPE